MTPFASVAMLEKLALLNIALCKAPAFSSASLRRTLVTICTAAGSLSRNAFCFIFVPVLNSDWRCPVLYWAVVSALLDFCGFALGQVVPGGKHAKHKGVLPGASIVASFAMGMPADAPGLTWRLGIANLSARRRF